MPPRWSPVTFLALLITSVMLSLTFVYWQNEETESADKRKQAFSVAVDQIADRIQHRMGSYELVLRGVKGFYDGSTRIAREDFRAYVQALQLEQTNSSLQGIGLALSTRQADKARVEAALRADGVPDFSIKPAGERSHYAPLILIEPRVGSNLAALGFDIETKAPASEALARARDTGAMALTKRLTLAQDAGQDAPPAVVMYVPIYAKGVRTDTLAGRQDGLIAWVNGPLRVRDLMAGLAGQMDADIGIALYEGDALSAANLLYRSAGAPLQAREQGTRQLDIGGQRWTLALHSLPAFDARFATDDHNRMALVGAVLSLLLGWLVWQLGTGRARAMAMARAMTQGLQEAKAELEGTLNAMPDLLFELGLDGHYYKYRTSRTDLLAAPPEVFIGKRVSDILPPAAADICLQALQEAHATGFSSGRQIELPIDGVMHWFEISVARNESASAAEPRFIVISRDITERKQAESQLRLSAHVFASSREGIVISDANNVIRSVNHAFTEITGYSAEEVIGKGPSLLKSGRQDAAFYASMWQSVQAQGNWQGEVWNRKKDGEIYPEWLAISSVKDPQGQVVQYIGMLSDLSAHKAAQERIDYLAHYDALTGLPNHVLMQDRTKLALATAVRTGESVALLSIDLDRFKNVNDSLGMPIGDSVLQAIASRLTHHLHTDDTLCRQGGDEFILLLPGTAPEGAAHVAKKLLNLVSQPVMVDAQPLSLTASIGIALFPENGADFEKLVQSSSAALNRAKQHGGNNFEFFVEEMHGQAHEVLMIENQLRRALAQGELLLHYQPQVDAVTSRIVGAEALIRWQHPDWGLVSPGRFIPIAESSGQILEIGNWVLHTAAQQVASWLLAGLDVVPVAVNLSALQFRQPSLCDTVREVLRSSGLPPAFLELELTESVAMEDSSFAIDQISKLHAMGLTLSIDDFGTGYSSLSYLKRYQIDKLKIDQSFVRDLDRSEGDGGIVRTIINLAHGLGFKTIAEGVETQQQLDFLRADGCDEIQGYFYSRPVPADAFARLLRTGGTLTGATAAV